MLEYKLVPNFPKRTKCSNVRCVVIVALLGMAASPARSDEPVKTIVRCNPDTLVLAAALGSAPTIETCLAAGVSLDQRGRSGDTPLLAAMKKNQWPIAKMLLEHGADPNLPDRDGNTALMEAVRSSRDVTRETTNELRIFANFLMDKGADPNRQNANGETALILAANIDNPSSVQLLLSRGADPNRATKDGSTVLLGLVDQSDNEKRNRLVIIEMLLDAGAHPDVKAARNGVTPLLTALDHRDDQVAEKLLEHGADVNVADRDGITPLHKAVERGSSTIITVLIQKGASVNARDVHGGTPLMTASTGGQVALLASAGADVNAVDERGATALMRAAEAGNEDVVGALLKAGAKVNAVDKKGRTAVMIANDEDKPGAARLLLEAGGIVMPAVESASSAPRANSNGTR
jgi:ankyrin repeat protein